MTVTVPEGNYLVWLQQGSVSGTPERVASKLASLQRLGSGPGTVYALDPASNRLAKVPVTGAALTIPSSSFTRVGTAILHVLDKTGHPMDYAQVKVSPAGEPAQYHILTPQDGGRIDLMDLPPGLLPVAIARGGVNVSESVDLNPSTAADPGIAVTLDAAPDFIMAETSATAPALRAHPTATTSAPVPAPQHGSGLGELLGALILLVAVLLLGTWMLKPERVRQLYNRYGERFGWEPLSTDAATAAASGTAVGAASGATTGRAPVAADPLTCPFCGTRKDANTGSCACSLVPTGVPTGSAAGTGAGASGAGVAALGGTSGLADPRLVAVEGPVRGQIFPIGGEITLGRDSNNTIALPSDTAVSRRHARLVSQNGQIEIIDEGSSNGTFVNGNRITQQLLRPQDEVQIGRSRFRFEA